MPDVELEYSPSSRAGGSAEPYVADWQMRSRVARSELAHGLVELAGGSLLILIRNSTPGTGRITALRPKLILRLFKNF